MQTVGVIGGGQLARMMQPAAIALGITCQFSQSLRVPLRTVL